MDLETAHNLLIDFLWAGACSQVYVIPPNVVKSTRGRYRQSGARSDQSDAFPLAASRVLRTDQARLQPWHPDSRLTRPLRAKVNGVAHLTRNTTRFSNRLRAVLWRDYPVATQIFSRLTRHIALHFVREFPTPRAAARLTYPAFQAFARAQLWQWVHRTATLADGRAVTAKLYAELCEAELAKLGGRGTGQLAITVVLLDELVLADVCPHCLTNVAFTHLR